jgi:hypothetical protein
VQLGRYDAEVSDLPAHSLNDAFELFDLAVRMCAQRFRREHPDADDVEVEASVQRWLLDRPGAPHGDAVGTPTSLPSTP